LYNFNKGGYLMDFKTMIEYVEANKKEHFDKIVANNSKRK